MQRAQQQPCAETMQRAQQQQQPQQQPSAEIDATAAALCKDASHSHSGDIEWGAMT